MTALDRIQKAEQILNMWLVDNTDQVFDEHGDIDDVRSLLIEAIEELKEK